MSKVAGNLSKAEQLRLVQQYRKITEAFLASHYNRRVSDNNQTSLEITQTSETISLKTNKLICSKKIESKLITIEGKHIPRIHQSYENVKISNISYETSHESERLLQGEKVMSYMLDKAVQVIGDEVESWVIDWEDHLLDRTLVIATVRTIEEQYQKIKMELRHLIEHRKGKGLLNILELNLRYPEPMELIDPLYNEFPELEDFFDAFNVSSLTNEDINALIELKSETLPYLMEVDLSLKNSKKKKKRKNKKKKIPTNITQKTDENPKDQKDVVEGQDRLNEVLDFIDNLQIDFQRRNECHVTQEWLANLDRQTRYSKILLQP